MTWVVWTILLLGASVLIAAMEAERGLLRRWLRDVFSGLLHLIELPLERVRSLAHGLRAFARDFLRPIAGPDRWLPQLSERAAQFLLGVGGYFLYIGGEWTLLTNTFRLEGFPTSWATLLGLAIIVGPILVELGRGSPILGYSAYTLILVLLVSLGWQRAIALSPESPNFPLHLPFWGGEVAVEAHLLLIHVLLPILLFAVATLIARVFLASIRDLIGIILIGAFFFMMIPALLGMGIIELAFRMLSALISGIWIALDHAIPILALPGRVWWNYFARLLGRYLHISPISEQLEILRDGWVPGGEGQILVEENGSDEAAEAKKQEQPDLWG